MWQELVGAAIGAKSSRRRKRSNRASDPLEQRTLLASLISSTKVTYQDVDGDNVTITFSKPILTPANVNTILNLSNGGVTGSNALKQQLQGIEIQGLSPANGTTISVVATRSPVNGGDGFAAVGYINAWLIDLGSVTVDGDLGQIRAGDSNGLTPALPSLTVHSMGRFGTSTGAPDIYTRFIGSIGKLTTKSDIRGAFVEVNGNIAEISVGGSLVGNNGFLSGAISALGNMGTVKIAGDLVGSSGGRSGSLICGGVISNVTISGSVIGGSGQASGYVQSDGSGPGTVSSVTIGGSIVGGTGNSSGNVEVRPSVGTLKIGGNVTGGSANSSGSVLARSNVATLTIGGSIHGGGDSYAGSVYALGQTGTFTLGGSLIGGSASGAAQLIGAGSIEGGRILNLTIGGSVIAGTDNTTGIFSNSGAIRTDQQLGTVTIKGSLIGNSTNPVLITAARNSAPTATSDLVIGKLTVNGRVELTKIIAGVERNGAEVNADAQIGPVTVLGDWVSSDLVAGANKGSDGLFGTGDDIKQSGGGVKDLPGHFSKIASITIGGQVVGNIDEFKNYGFVAENIGALKIGGNTFPLITGNTNDFFLVGLVGDTRVREI